MDSEGGQPSQVSGPSDSDKHKENCCPLRRRFTVESLPTLAELIGDTLRLSPRRGPMFVVDIGDPEVVNYERRCKVFLQISPSDKDMSTDYWILQDEIVRYDPRSMYVLQEAMKVLTTVYVRRHRNNWILFNPCSEEDIDTITLEEGLMSECYQEIEQISMNVWEKIDEGTFSGRAEWNEDFLRRFYACLQIIKVSFLAVRCRPPLEIIHELDLAQLRGWEPHSYGLLRQITNELCKKIEEDENEEMNNRSFLSKVKHEVDIDDYLEDTSLTSELRNKTENESEIAYLLCPKIELFRTHMRGSIPCVMLGIVANWAAFENNKWSVDYIEKVGGYRTVPVEVVNRLKGTWRLEFLRMSDFIKRFIKMYSTQSFDVNGHVVDEIACMLEFDVFSHILKLSDDVAIPNYCFPTKGPRRNVDVKALFTPKNWISQLRFDEKDTLVVQIFGSRAIRLFPPTETKIFSKFPGFHANTSFLNLEDVDLFEKVPEMREAMHFDLILKPEQTLFIPANWWCYARSLETSFAASFGFEIDLLEEEKEGSILISTHCSESES